MNLINKVCILYDKQDKELVVYLEKILKWLGIITNIRSYSMIEKITNNKLDESGYYDYFIVISNIPKNINLKFNEDDKIIYNHTNNIKNILYDLFKSDYINVLIEIYNKNNFFINDLIYESNIFYTKENKIKVLHNYKKFISGILNNYYIDKENIYLKYILYSTMLKVDYLNKSLGYFTNYDNNLLKDLNQEKDDIYKLKSFYLLNGEYNKLIGCKKNIIPYYEKAIDEFSLNPINSQIYYKIANDISIFDDYYLNDKYNLRKLFHIIRNYDKFFKLPEFCESLFHHKEDIVREEYQDFILIEELKSDIKDMTPKEFNKYIYYLYQYHLVIENTYQDFYSIANNYITDNILLKKIPNDISNEYTNDILKKTKRINQKFEKTKKLRS